MAKPRVFVTRVVAQEALDNIIITPHIASASFTTRKNMALMAAENLLAELRDQAPPSCVNPETLKG